MNLVYSGLLTLLCGGAVVKYTLWFIDAYSISFSVLGEEVRAQIEDGEVSILLHIIVLTLLILGFFLLFAYTLMQGFDLISGLE